MLFDVRSLAVYAAIYAASLLVLVLAAFVRLWPRDVRLDPSPSAMRAEVHEGLPYSVSSATATASGEIDKSLMLRLAGELATGQYSAASRVVQAAVMPVQALMVSIAPRWFRAHAQGGASRERRIAIGIAIAYAVIAAAGCWACAPLLPWLLGSGFEASVPVLRFLSVAIVTGSLRQVTMMMTMTSDLQGSRNMIELAALALFVASMIVLIPRHGATGAVVATVLADGLAILLGTAALARARDRAAVGR
jgi:O-antigen/teichoic acid export membrane protein